MKRNHIMVIILATSLLSGCETYGSDDYSELNNSYYTPSTPYNSKVVYYRYETNRYYAKGDYNLTYNRMYDMPYLDPSYNRNCCHLTYEKDYYLNNPKVVTYEDNDYYAVDKITPTFENPTIYSPTDTKYYPPLPPIPLK